MAKRLIVEGTYTDDPDALFERALDVSQMLSDMSGFAIYEGDSSGTFIEGRTYKFDVTIWGWIKNPAHNIYVETADRGKRIFKTLEHSEGSKVKRWDHTLIVFEKDNETVWRDDVIIDAGWLGFAVARLARKMYLYRHKSRDAISISASIENM